MVTWADSAEVADAVDRYAADLKERDERVTRVLWYGSWVSGIPTPGSDVDVCVVLSEDERPPRERIPDYLPTRFPTGIDLIVVTEEELEVLATRAPTWHRAIMSGQEV